MIPTDAAVGSGDNLNFAERVQRARAEYREKAREEAAFDRHWELVGKAWDHLVDHLADQGFGVDGSLVSAIESRLGLQGAWKFVEVLTSGDAARAQRFCDLVTDEERRRAEGRGWCYNRLLVRRGAGGKLLIVIEQVGNPDYLPPLVMTHSAGPLFAPRRARARESRGRAFRRRGSRRVTGRSSGGGDGGDSEGEPEPRWGLAEQITGALR